MLLSLFGRKDKDKEKDKANGQDANSASPSSLPRAVAFVDYESWYVSLKTTYAILPDIKGWFEELNRHYQLIDVTFFADFSHRSLADELRRIRPYTNKIIDTRSPNGVEKDYTDFIILDNIYQKALSAGDIQTFILFSGDGHFSSAVAFLKNFYHKNVVVYGIQDCFSGQLREAASEVHILPDEKQLNRGIHQTVFDYLRRAAVPTYDGALQWVSDKHRTVSRKTVQTAIDLLEKRGVLSQHNLPGSREKQLFISWEKAEEWLDLPLAEYLAQPVEPIRPNRRNEHAETRSSDDRSGKQSGHGDQPHFKLKDAHGADGRKQDANAQKQDGQKQRNAQQNPQPQKRKPDGEKQATAPGSPEPDKSAKPNGQPDRTAQKQQEKRDLKAEGSKQAGRSEQKQTPKKQEPKTDGAAEQVKQPTPAPEKPKADEPVAEQQPVAAKPKSGSRNRKKKESSAPADGSVPAETAAQASEPKQPGPKAKKRRTAKAKPKAEPSGDENGASKQEDTAKEPSQKADEKQPEQKLPQDQGNPKQSQKQQQPQRNKQKQQPQNRAEPAEETRSEANGKPKAEPKAAEQPEAGQAPDPDVETAGKPRSSGRRRRRSGSSKPKADAGEQTVPAADPDSNAKGNAIGKAKNNNDPVNQTKEQENG